MLASYWLRSTAFNVNDVPDGHQVHENYKFDMGIVRMLPSRMFIMIVELKTSAALELPSGRKKLVGQIQHRFDQLDEEDAYGRSALGNGTVVFLAGCGQCFFPMKKTGGDDLVYNISEILA